MGIADILWPPRFDAGAVVRGWSDLVGWVSDMGSGSDRSGWWHGGQFGQASEVPDSGGQQELVPCAGEPSEPEPGETEVPFQVSETGLDFLALASGLEEWFCSHQASGMVARRLMHDQDKTHRTDGRADLPAHPS